MPSRTARAILFPSLVDGGSTDGIPRTDPIRPAPENRKRKCIAQRAVSSPQRAAAWAPERLLPDTPR